MAGARACACIVRPRCRTQPAPARDPDIEQLDVAARRDHDALERQRVVANAGGIDVSERTAICAANDGASRVERMTADDGAQRLPLTN